MKRKQIIDLPTTDDNSNLNVDPKELSKGALDDATGGDSGGYSIQHWTDWSKWD